MVEMAMAIKTLASRMDPSPALKKVVRIPLTCLNLMTHLIWSHPRVITTHSVALVRIPLATTLPLRWNLPTLLLLLLDLTMSTPQDTRA